MQNFSVPVPRMAVVTTTSGPVVRAKGDDEAGAAPGWSSRSPPPRPHPTPPHPPTEAASLLRAEPRLPPGREGALWPGGGPGRCVVAAGGGGAAAGREAGRVRHFR